GVRVVSRRVLIDGRVIDGIVERRALRRTRRTELLDRDHLARVDAAEVRAGAAATTHVRVQEQAYGDRVREAVDGVLQSVTSHVPLACAPTGSGRRIEHGATHVDDQLKDRRDALTFALPSCAFSVLDGFEILRRQIDLAAVLFLAGSTLT